MSRNNCAEHMTKESKAMTDDVGRVAVERGKSSILILIKTMLTLGRL
jgi:hypothetical protein